MGPRLRAALAAAASSIALTAGCGARTWLGAPPPERAGMVGTGGGSTSGTAGTGGTAVGSGGAGGCVGSGGPTPIAHDADAVFAVTADATFAYWTNIDHGTISKVSLCEGVQTTVATGEGSSASIKVDASHVYWGAGSGLRRAPLAGGAPSTVWGDGSVEDIALDDTRAYFSVRTGPPLGGIWRADKDGSNPVQLLAGDVTGPVAVDGTSVYFSTGSLGVASTLAKLPKDMGSPVTLASFLVQGAIRAEGAYVYVATWEAAPGDPSNVLRIPQDGGPATILAAGEPGPVTGLALTGDRVVWTSESAGAVRAAPKDGGMATTVASNQSVPEQAASGGGWIVWVNFTDGSLWRAAAP